MIGPPSGTPFGDYAFTVDVLCSGEVVAQQQVVIHVGNCSLVAVTPADAQACEGDTLDLDGSASLTAGCNGDLLYQWYRDGAVIRPWDFSPTATDIVPPGTSVYSLEISCFSDPDCGGSARA